MVNLDCQPLCLRYSCQAYEQVDDLDDPVIRAGKKADLSQPQDRYDQALSGATEKLAQGDLTQRVEEGAADEIGQLARRFNEMAA